MGVTGSNRDSEKTKRDGSSKKQENKETVILQ